MREFFQTIDHMDRYCLSSIDDIYVNMPESPGEHTPESEIPVSDKDPLTPNVVLIRGRKLPTGLAKETIRQVKDIEDTLKKIDDLPKDWFHCGTKWEVPHNACYRGHCGSVYVWVLPEGREELAKFSLAILKLASVIKEPQLVTAPSGIQFSPALSQQR